MLPLSPSERTRALLTVSLKNVRGRLTAHNVVLWQMVERLAVMRPAMLERAVIVVSSSMLSCTRTMALVVPFAVMRAIISAQFEIVNASV